MSWTRLGGGSKDYHYWASDWTNMYLDYAASDDWTIRVGQAPNWFGLEGAQDSSERMSFERAAFLSRIPNLKPKGEPVELKMDWRSGLYYAGRWDRGVWFIRHRKSAAGPQAILGLINGNFRNIDDNSHKALSLDLKWERPWGQYGVSWLDSKTSQSPDLDRNAVLGYARWALPDQRWAVQAEYMDGKLLGEDADGWYGQFEYQLTKNPTWAFIKWEEFNTTDQGDAVNYDALHIGVTKQLSEKNELTLQWTDGEIYNDRKGETHKRDEIGLQWQTIFE